MLRRRAALPRRGGGPAKPAAQPGRGFFQHRILLAEAEAYEAGGLRVAVEGTERDRRNARLLDKPLTECLVRFVEAERPVIGDEKIGAGGRLHAKPAAESPAESRSRFSCCCRARPSK